MWIVWEQNAVKQRIVCVCVCVRGNKYKKTYFLFYIFYFLFYRCKTLVAINGFNAFFHPKTCVMTEAKVKVPPSKITLTEAFVEITKYDWVSINLTSL
jgi:hypothetical protein